MGLTDDLQNVPLPEPQSKCGILLVKQKLASDDPKALKALEARLTELATTDGNSRKNGQSGLTYVWLANVLQANGFDISKSTVNRHVKGMCRCGAV